MIIKHITSQTKPILFTKTRYLSTGDGKVKKNISTNLNAKTTSSLREYDQMLSSTLPLLFNEDLAQEGKRLTQRVKHMLTNKGSEFTVRYLKATHESLEHILYELEGPLKHEKIGISKDSDGWPTWLGEWLKSSFMKRETTTIRFLFTMCTTRRLITVQTNTYLKSITDAPTVDTSIALKPILESVGGTVSNYSNWIRQPEIGTEAISKISEMITTYQTPRLQVSLKSTPNGIGYFSFPWDRASIIAHNLVEKLSDFASSYYKGNVDDWVYDKIEPYEDLVDSNRQLHCGKISLTLETGKLKPRIFAIVDSVTQSLLSDFHDDLMNILKDIPEDCTFNHDKIVSSAKRVSQRDKPFYGYADMSDVTDRLPKQLYQEIGDIWRPGLGTSWVDIFDRPFHVSKSVNSHWDTTKARKDNVRYTTGQPMGALSSWPFMAFVHHCLVWHSFGSRKAARGQYHVLGDDVVIFNEKAYHKYLLTLDSLGVSYTNNFSTVGFEFAKRNFHQGKEVTGAYTQALLVTKNVPELFAMEWRNLSSRGYSTNIDHIISLQGFLKISKKKLNKIKDLMTVPYGTEIQLESLANFICSLTGRSTCFLQKGNNEQLVEATKAFRQASSFLIKQDFQVQLNAAKAASSDNLKSFSNAFKTHSGLGDQYTTVIQEAINEYKEDSNTRIRYLERDLKNLYLDPTDKTLLRPNLPDLPRPIDFTRRDKATERMKFQAEHQLRLINFLRG